MEYSMKPEQPHLGDIEALNAHFAELGLVRRLKLAVTLGRSSILTTSLGLEDQVLTAAIALARLPVRIATLDTGRLFAETTQLIEDTEKRFHVAVERFLPDETAVARYVNTRGLDGFYESVEARHECCNIRKLEPLARALQGADVWITGLRRGQSENRSDVPFVEWDAKRNLFKINPLADWSVADLQAYAKWNRVPLNPLHERGYPSIGCEPCTRAIKPGEPERAGRWWWERDEKRECGLHVPDQTPLAQPVASAMAEQAA
jgi:phosphoadenosine phosphosulfate reductase